MTLLLIAVAGIALLPFLVFEDVRAFGLAVLALLLARLSQASDHHHAAHPVSKDAAAPR